MALPAELPETAMIPHNGVRNCIPCDPALDSSSMLMLAVFLRDEGMNEHHLPLIVNIGGRCCLFLRLILTPTMHRTNIGGFTGDHMPLMCAIACRLCNALKRGDRSVIIFAASPVLEEEVKP